MYLLRAVVMLAVAGWFGWLAWNGHRTRRIRGATLLGAYFDEKARPRFFRFLMVSYAALCVAFVALAAGDIILNFVHAPISN
jgi:hypothetical protein